MGEPNAGSGGPKHRTPEPGGGSICTGLPMSAGIIQIRCAALPEVSVRPTAAPLESEEIEAFDTDDDSRPVAGG